MTQQAIEIINELTREDRDTETTPLADLAVSAEQAQQVVGGEVIRIKRIRESPEPTP